MAVEKSAGSDYRTRQKKVGDALRRDTRSRILEAAKTEFAQHGYAATTVTRLAAAAGVSLQTLYLAWGSKRELLRGYMEHVLAGGADSPEDAGDRFANLSPRERLSELADLVAEIAARAATGWRLYRDAGAGDPEIAADWNELQLLRHRLFTRIVSDIPTTALRDGLTRTSAHRYRMDHRQPRKLRLARPPPQLRPQPLPRLDGAHPHQRPAQTPVIAR